MHDVEIRDLGVGRPPQRFARADRSQARYVSPRSDRRRKASRECSCHRRRRAAACPRAR
jgi:hypothetical protein